MAGISAAAQQAPLVTLLLHTLPGWLPSRSSWGSIGKVVLLDGQRLRIANMMTDPPPPLTEL